MTTVIILLCLFLTIIVLGILAIIDLKIRILPNKYVGLFFLLGILFHIFTDFTFVTPAQMVTGTLAGGGLLLAIRFIANKIYKKDTLGLGDVKLMGAAGAWVGIDYIFLALSFGAFFGLVHGVVYKLYMAQKTGEHIPLSSLSIPAGPGFIAGTLVVGILMLSDLPHFLLDF